MNELKAPGKPFVISKRAVWEAYKKVKANKGAPGVDAVSLAAFEKDLKNNLYKIWNRMSSGTYFPPPVRAVEIPKTGGGVRILGVPTVADRIAQTVAARVLEAKVEKIFHPDSYGYRPRRSTIDAVAACRSRCWRYDWVIDLDIQKFFDTVPWDLLLKAVAAHTDQPWVLLYAKRWLKAPLQQPDGTMQERDRGTPQGSAISPALANRRFQSVMATQCFSISSPKTSTGFRQLSVLRGLPFNSAATLSSSSWVCKDKSVPFGKYCRSSPLVFSLVPRCHGEWGSQK